MNRYYYEYWNTKEDKHVYISYGEFMHEIMNMYFPHLWKWMHTAFMTQVKKVGLREVWWLFQWCFHGTSILSLACALLPNALGSACISIEISLPFIISWVCQWLVVGIEFGAYESRDLTTTWCSKQCLLGIWERCLVRNIQGLEDTTPR